MFSYGARKNSTTLGVPVSGASASTTPRSSPPTSSNNLSVSCPTLPPFAPENGVGHVAPSTSLNHNPSSTTSSSSSSASASMSTSSNNHRIPRKMSHVQSEPGSFLMSSDNATVIKVERPSSSGALAIPSSPLGSHSQLAGSPTSSGLLSNDEEKVVSFYHELSEQSKEVIRKKSEKMLKRELNKRQKEEEKVSKKNKREEKKKCKLQKKFELTTEAVNQLINEFRCAYHKRGIIHHGKLYIFPEHVCFSSSSGLTIVKITVAQVAAVTLKTINAIQFIVNTPDGKQAKYYFGHWHHRERAFKTFHLLWRRAQGDKSIDLNALRDPARLKQLSDLFKTLPGTETQHSQEFDAIDEPDSTEHDQVVTNSEASPSTERAEPVNLPPTAPALGYTPPHIDKAPDASSSIPISLAQLWDTFLGPKSDHYPEVHRTKGDREVRGGTWEPRDGCAYLVRTIHFESEIKSKLMKGKMCVVDQEQQACVTCPSRLLFGTDSRMSGPPYSSDFTVRTYWEFVEETKTSTAVNAWCWVNWVAKPPFGLIKGTIEKGSVNGGKEFFEIFMRMAKDKVKTIKAGPESKGKEKEDERTPDKGKESKDNGAATVTSPAQSSITVEQQTASSSDTKPMRIHINHWMLLALVGLAILVTFTSCVLIFIGRMQAQPQQLINTGELTGTSRDTTVTFSGDAQLQEMAQKWNDEIDSLQRSLQNLTTLLHQLREEVATVTSRKPSS